MEAKTTTKQVFEDKKLGSVEEAKGSIEEAKGSADGAVRSIEELEHPLGCPSDDDDSVGANFTYGHNSRALQFDYPPPHLRWIRYD